MNSKKEELKHPYAGTGLYGDSLTFSRTKVYENPESGESASYFIHNAMYILATNNSVTSSTDFSRIEKTRVALGFTEEVFQL